MRQLSAFLAIAAGSAALAAPGVAGAVQPAVPPATPAEVPAAVVQAVNALSVEASPCSLLTRDLREAIAVRELLAHDPLATEPFGPDDVTRLCDAHVVASVGRDSGDEPRGGWLRTEVRPARVVALRGEVAHVRLRARQRYTRDWDWLQREEEADLLVVREEGAWRLASLDRLLELSGTGFSTRGDTLGELLREREERDAETAGLLRGHARLVRELAEVPRPFARRTLACGTGRDAVRSGRAEPKAGDVRRLDGRFKNVKGPRAARSDLVDVRLSSGHGRLCWTFLLRGAPADRIDLEVLMAQDGPPRADDLNMGGWTLRLDGGRAVGLLDPLRRLRQVFPVRASVHGRVVRAVVPAAKVRGTVQLKTRFGWSVMSRTPDPDRPPGSTVTWVDSLPRLERLSDLAGIDHPPVRRGR